MPKILVEGRLLRSSPPRLPAITPGDNTNTQPVCWPQLTKQWSVPYAVAALGLASDNTIVVASSTSQITVRNRSMVGGWCKIFKKRI